MKEPHACPTRRGEDSCAILHVVNKAAANSVNFTSLNLTNLQGKAALAKKNKQLLQLFASFLPKLGEPQRRLHLSSPRLVRSGAALWHLHVRRCTLRSD